MAKRLTIVERGAHLVTDRYTYRGIDIIKTKNVNGWGGFRPEYQTVGIRPHIRAHRQDEMIVLIDRKLDEPLWFEDAKVEHEPSIDLRVDLTKPGRTNHSADAATLKTLVRALERQRIPYRITAVPGEGYGLEWGVDISS